MIRESEKNRNEQLRNTLKHQNLTSIDWWTTLKTFISSLYRNSNAAMENDGIIYSESIDKANPLKDFFREQNATLPSMPPFNGTILNFLVIKEADA